jgi:hypothetical protein
MLNIVYLTYQAGYSFANDHVFQKWVNQVDIALGVGTIVIVDNFDEKRKAETRNWGNATVNVIAGDNTAREFSGYQRGLSALHCHEGIVLLLNDTFLSPKHRPWALLLPAVIQMSRKLQKVANDFISGEINRGPMGATFDGAPATWISTYCMLFSCVHLNAVQAAIREAMKVFHDQDTKFNSKFTEHIDRQIAGLPTSKSQGARLRKIQATAAEMSLTRMLQSTSLPIKSIYSVTISPWLFAKYTAMRIMRKMAFVALD